MITRRNFTKLTATAIGSMPLMGFRSPLFNAITKPKDELTISLFSKHLQFLDYNDMAAAAAEIGFDGLDLTVRPKGHVIPEKVVDDLPKAVAAMKKYGINPSMMTTNVWDVNNSEQKTILETASTLGFSHYRTDWLKYPEDRTIAESQTIYRKQAAALEVLNLSNTYLPLVKRTLDWAF